MSSIRSIFSRVVVSLGAAMLFGSMCSADAPAGPVASMPPLFVYSFTGNPSVVTPSGPSPGIIPSVLIALGERPNVPLTARLKAALEASDPRMRFEQAFGCVLTERCQSVVLLGSPPFADNRGLGPPSEELQRQLRARNLDSAWVLNIIEQFHVGGYNFSVRATQIALSDKGATRIRRVHANYMDMYSRKLDAQTRGLSEDLSTATPKFGSKEAKPRWGWD